MSNWFQQLWENWQLRPLAEGWEEHLARNVAHYRLLNESEQARLRACTQALAAEKYWEGCGGLQITDEIRVTISAQASLLLLGLDDDTFGRVKTILVYPAAFRHPGEDGQDQDQSQMAMAGQAVYRGPVILAWDAVLADGLDPAAGRNVVIHEFAHQLDFLDGSTNGTPDLTDAEQGERWRQVMTREFNRLREESDSGWDTFLGDYAAVNETEFFSVASERFFTVPESLHHNHPALYDVLADYYGVQPIAWFAHGARADESA